MTDPNIPQYYIADGQTPRGPYSLNDLRMMGLDPQQRVWRRGMPEWIHAYELPELQQPIPNQHYGYTPEAERPAPPHTFNGQGATLITLSAVLGTCCCIPMLIPNVIFGILAIVFSNKAKAAYEAGDYDQAAVNSRVAKKMKRLGWIFLILVFVLGLIYVIIQIMAGAVSGMSEMYYY